MCQQLLCAMIQLCCVMDHEEKYHQYLADIERVNAIAVKDVQSLSLDCVTGKHSTCSHKT
jgi:hypothetical protein